MTTQNRQLGDLRSELLARLGFGAAGSASITNSTIIDSFLRSAQEQLYWQYEWIELLETSEQATGVDQRFYDYPSDCEVERIREVSILDGETYYPVTEGVTMAMRSDLSSGRPRCYERAAQIEVWPPADVAYTLRIDYIRALGRFTNDSDRTTIKSELVFLHALANAKLHYRQPDAAAYSNQLQAILARLKAAQRTTAPIRRGQASGEWDALSPPRVVGRD